MLPIQPMLARALPEGRTINDYASSDHVLEVKYDGHRIILDVGPNDRKERSITAYSRNGNVRLLAPRIIAELKWVSAGLYDGELIIPGGTSTDVVNLDLIGRSELVLFDIMRLGTLPLTTQPLHKRRELLQQATGLVTNGHAVRLAQRYPVSELTLKSWWARGEEGGIVKNVHSLYEAGKRSLNWVKFKRQEAAELTIVGFEEGLLGPHSKIVCRDAHGVEITVKTLNDEWRANFARHADQYIGKTLVISYQQKTGKNKYRHPMADHIL